MASLVDRAISEVLAGERSVVAFEEELAAIYAVSENEIIDVVRAFFQKHSKNGKISFAALRRYLDAQAWHTFSLVLTDWQQESEGDTPRVTKSFANDITKLLRRKTITNLEELTFRVRYSIEKRAVREESTVSALLAVNVLAAYYARFYGMSRESERGIKFIPLTDSELLKLVYAKWDDNHTLKSFDQRIQSNAERLLAEYELVIKQAIAAGMNTDAMAKIIANRMTTAFNRDKFLVRTETNRAMSAADIAAYKQAEITWYWFRAVLDEVTTTICRTLDGNRFRVSQAQEQVNLPPMHVNCRSTTEPDIEDIKYEDGEDLLNLSRTISLRKFIEENYEGAYLDEVLDFIESYYK